MILVPSHGHGREGHLGRRLLKVFAKVRLDGAHRSLDRLRVELRQRFERSAPGGRNAKLAARGTHDGRGQLRRHELLKLVFWKPNARCRGIGEVSNVSVAPASMQAKQKKHTLLTAVAEEVHVLVQAAARGLERERGEQHTVDRVALEQNTIGKKVFQEMQWHHDLDLGVHDNFESHTQKSQQESITEIARTVHSMEPRTISSISRIRATE